MAKSSLKLWLVALLFLFIALANAQSSDDDDSSASSESSDSSDSDSPDSPDSPTTTRDPEEEGLEALIQACPCLEELGGDEDDALAEVSETCVGSASSDEEAGECTFQEMGDDSSSTLTCEEDVVALNVSALTCTVTEIGDDDEAETITLTAAQAAICAEALSGLSDFLECEVTVCGNFTMDTDILVADIVGDVEAFALELVTQVVDNADVEITIDETITNAEGLLVIEYTLCAGSQEEIDAAEQNAEDAAANGTVFDVNDQDVSLTGSVPGTTTTEAPLETSSAPTAEPTMEPIARR